MISVLPTRGSRSSASVCDRFCLTSDVVELADEDGSLRLINLGRDSIALDSYSATLLRHILQHGINTTVIMLSRTYGIEEDRAEADVRDFIRDLTKRGFVESDSPMPRDSRAARIRKHALLRCVTWMLCRIAKRRNMTRQVWWSLAVARAAAKLCGWQATVEAFQRAFFPAMLIGEPSQRLTSESIDSMVREVAATFPFIVECKERALSCYAQCRLRGVSAELIVGFSTCPFEGHAWVETSDGTIISDHAEHCQTWQPVIRYI